MIKIFKLGLICIGFGGYFPIFQLDIMACALGMSQIPMSKSEKNSFEMLQTDFRRFTFLGIAEICTPSLSFSARLHSIYFAPSRGRRLFSDFQRGFLEAFLILYRRFSRSSNFAFWNDCVLRVHSIIASLWRKSRNMSVFMIEARYIRIK